MAKSTRKPVAKKENESKTLAPASRDYTINLHKLCHKTQFKKKAPKALKEIRHFAVQNMKTDDVRIDSEVNQWVWSQGIRNIPRRVRVRLSRKKNETDDAENKFYTEVKLLQVDTFKGLTTEKSKDN
jgi:large subunit ribosomal protein L31e